MGKIVGLTHFIAYAGEQRYLRITIDASVHGDTAVALLGHELQHAVEIARAPWVTNETRLAHLYRHIGHESAGSRAGNLRVDTPEGLSTERQVLAELRAGSKTLRAVGALVRRTP
jgi:hypothetical protein